MAIYVICCIVYEVETLLIPQLGTADIKLFALMFLVTSIFIGLYLPVQYKLGYEKAKFAFLVIIMTSPIIVPLLLRMENLKLDFLSTTSPYLISGSTVLLGSVLLAVSAFLSMKIYAKADLA